MLHESSWSDESAIGLVASECAPADLFEEACALRDVGGEHPGELSPHRDSRMDDVRPLSFAAAGSYREAVTRFDTLGVADKYPSAFHNSWRDRREVACLQRFLASLPRGSRVLDLPCGTGRLTALLAERGLDIVGADSSPRMVDLARANWTRWQARHPESSTTTQFSVREGGATGFSDGEFDGIVCNRLFHHFRESEIRVEVLREFRRICNGRMFVSFFNSFAVDAVRFRLKHWLRGTTPTDRIPIPMSEMAADIERAGLKILRTAPVAWGLSPMWYVEMCPVTR